MNFLGKKSLKSRRSSKILRIILLWLFKLVPRLQMFKVILLTFWRHSLKKWFACLALCRNLRGKKNNVLENGTPFFKKTSNFLKSLMPRNSKY
jgi:hypothetical protein